MKYSRKDIKDSDITSYMLSIVNSKPPDCFLYSNNGWKIGIHKEVFIQTPFMREILTNAEGHRQDDLEIFFPGLCMEELQKVIGFLYTGEIITRNTTAKQLMELLKILGFSDTTLDIAILDFSPMDTNNEVPQQTTSASPNVEVQEDQSLDVFDPNAPSSSLQIIKGFSLPNANDGDASSNHSNLFSSDEEDIDMNGENGSVQNADLNKGANESESLENRLLDFSTDTEQGIGKEISAQYSQQSVVSEINPLPSTSGTVPSTSATLPSTSGILPSPYENMAVSASADPRKVSPLKVIIPKKPPQKSRKRKSKEIDETLEDGGIRPKKKKARKIVKKFECKRCNQVVKETILIQHFASHIGEADPKPVPNGVDNNYDCILCQFSSKKHIVNTHIYEKHRQNQLLERGSELLNEQITSIGQLYNLPMPFLRPPSPPP